MSMRPIIFISAVSKELHSARDLVAKTLTALGYDPKWQDIAATETGDLRGVLRKWVDASDAVLQLVGHCYGFAPKEDDPHFGPCSYTQYEALYARQQGKPVYYLFTDPAHPTDGCGCEPETLHDLQEKYRSTVKSYGDLYHSTSSLTHTELLVRRLKDDLAQLHKRGKQHAALVLGLLVALLLGGAWMMRNQNDSKQQLEVLSQELKDGQAELRKMIETSINGGSEKKLTADYEAALRFIAHRRGIGLDAFRSFLDQNATRVLGDAAVPLKDKVRALQEAGQFVLARDFALQQARRLESQRQQSSKEEVELWTEAAKTELTLGHYDKALEHASQAVRLTSPAADFPSWSAARHQQGRALRYVRKDREARALYEELIPLQQADFGPDHLAVFQSRRLLAVISSDLGEAEAAEQQKRVLLADCQRVLGAEHYETLANQVNLATAMYEQGKYAEAEQEYRAVLKIQVRVLGAEHPDTLAGRNNLASMLDEQGRHAEAEQEHRAVLKLRERVLGAGHPDSLMSRMNLANAVDDQGRHAEAEAEHRAVLKIKERVLGAEHPDVAQSCYNLALCLKAQQKLPEALAFMQRAEQMLLTALGPEHPDAKLARAAREQLEDALRQTQTQ